MKKTKIARLYKKETLYAWLFIAPHIIGFLIFKLIPIIAAFLLSFCQWRLLDTIKWVGFKNFIDMYHDPIFVLSMKNTLIFTIISVPVSLTLSLIVAIQLNKKLYAKVLLRTVYFIPYISTITAVSSVWIWFFHPEGLLSGLMITIGIENPPVLLLDKNTVVYCLAVIQAWRSIGYAMLIFLAGLQAIPAELYESADIDGAKGFHKFKSITWPMLTPTTFFLVVTSLIFTFQAFDLIYAVTEGGPGTSSHVIAYYIYKTGFKFFRLGYSSALSIVLFVIIISITLIQWKGQKNWVNE